MALRAELGGEPWPGRKVDPDGPAEVLAELTDAFGECTAELFGGPDEMLALASVGRDGEPTSIEIDSGAVWAAAVRRMPEDEQSEHCRRESEIGRMTGNLLNPKRRRKPPRPKSECPKCGALFTPWPQLPYCDKCRHGGIWKLYGALNEMGRRLNDRWYTHVVEDLIKQRDRAMNKLTSGDWRGAMRDAKDLQRRCRRVPKRGVPPPWWPDRPSLQELGTDYNTEHAAIVTARRKFIMWYSKQRKWDRRRRLTDRQMLAIRNHPGWRNPLWVNAPRRFGRPYGGWR